MSLFGDAPRSRPRRSLALGQETAQQASSTVTGRVALSGQAQRSLLQKPRHTGLFEAVRRLDMQLDDADRRNLIDWISEQYVTEYGDVPLGFMAKCYLGAPYADHRLNLGQAIVEHFTPSDSVPAPFDRARGLARHSAYEYVEVYASGQLVAIRSDGMTEILPGGN